MDEKWSTTALDKMRSTGDALADKVYAQLYEEHVAFGTLGGFAEFQYNHQQIPDSFPPYLQAYFQEIEAKGKDYASSYVIKQAGKFFQQNAPEMLAGLGLMSLPYCYAAADGAQVLYFSERLRHAPDKRLLETAQFVFDVCEPFAFAPQGKALRSIAKVRLMHAAVRYHLRHDARWDMAWGLPINQEDMAGTNLAFSIVLLRALRKLGKAPSKDEEYHFLSLWKATGQLLGIEDALLPADMAEALSLEKRIMERNFKTSSEGVELTAILLRYMGAQLEAQMKISMEEWVAYMLGPHISKLLEIPSTLDGQAIIERLMQTRKIIPSFSWLGNSLSSARLRFAQQKKGLQKNGVSLQPFRLLGGLKS